MLCRRPEAGTAVALLVGAAVMSTFTVGCGRFGFQPLASESGDATGRDGDGDGDGGLPGAFEEPDGAVPGELDAGTPPRDGLGGDPSDAGAGADASATNNGNNADAGGTGASCGPTYVADDRCGVGYCQANNAPSTCLDGVATACQPAQPLSPTDATCDGVDDDCDGNADEDYAAPATNCGVGQCAGNAGMLRCMAGMPVDTCDPFMGATADDQCNGVDEDCDGMPDDEYVAAGTSCGLGACAGNAGALACMGGTPVDTCDPFMGAAADDSTPDGGDDDCDGSIDEDACPGSTEALGAGAWMRVPPSGCTKVHVKLWGGAGASAGSGGFWGSASAGLGGAGGYAAGEYAVTSASSLNILVGQGGRGCSGAGTNPTATYNGGAGGTGRGGPGSPGASGNNGGGTGGSPGSGGAGGRGDFGGGGGGAGTNPGFASSGDGGGGGAASLLALDGTRVMTAGGGGGGGGVGSTIATNGVSGGNGGSGCGGNGAVAGSQGGGGGGGGLCEVQAASAPVTQAGSGPVPFDPGGADTPPAGTAVGGDYNGGGNSDCNAGGDGYAILTWSR